MKASSDRKASKGTPAAVRAQGPTGKPGTVGTPAACS
jgi:hypothetical protein